MATLNQLPPVIARPIARLMELDQESIFALADIAAERVRQIEGEKWTPDHDDKHSKGEMARAAGCYALEGWTAGSLLRWWPWSEGWWKPGSLHRNQVRAGALLVAELARHLRSAPVATDRERKVTKKCQHGNVIDQRVGLSCALCVPDETVKIAASGIQRLFIMRETEEPMPSYEDIARAALEAVIK